MEITEKLNKLANFYAQRDLVALQKQELIDAILTSEIKARLSEIESEFALKSEGVNANIANLESEIRASVLAAGISIRGEFLHAVFSKGRVSWDTRGLDGYAIAHPEITSFRKTGEPSVSIRKI